MILEWDHDAAGDADLPTWAREAHASELRIPQPGQHGPATRRLIKAQRTAKAIVWAGVSGVAMLLWWVLWLR